MNSIGNIYKGFIPVNELRDVHKRYNFSYDLNNSFYQPTVSEYLYNKGFKPVYPNGANFAICISHDIDKLFDKTSPGRLLKGLSSLNYGRTKRELQLIANKKGFEYGAIISQLESERKNQIHSTYFFLSLSKSETDYNYTPLQIKEIFDLVNDNGSEIGLHGGHDAAYNEIKLKQEKEDLERACSRLVTGYRGHYLKFDYPKTWQYLQNCGIAYDSTFSYPDVVGFRNGMCYPFLPLGQKNKIVELPLIISDHIFDNYMRTDKNAMMTITKELLQKVSSLSGVFTFLWHNAYYKRPFIELYEMIVEYGKKQNAWFASGIEIAEWWDKQGYFSEYLDIAPEIFE